MPARAPSLDVAVVIDHAPWRRSVRGLSALCREGAAAALAATGVPGRPPLEVAFLLTDDEALRLLNRDYRGRNKPTNVLSFPAGEGGGPGGLRHLGDIALAYETVRREAAEQGKAIRHHLLHLVVHGMLHLLGHDHEDPAEAERMESLERRVLAGLGIADPYAWRARAERNVRP